DGLAANADLADRRRNGGFVSMEKSPPKEIFLREGYALRLQFRISSLGSDRAKANDSIPRQKRRARDSRSEKSLEVAGLLPLPNQDTYRYSHVESQSSNELR
ncbi:MAG: hypothetical protein ACXW3L_02060, partial [Limisphaerales bacterium]